MRAEAAGACASLPLVTFVPAGSLLIRFESRADAAGGGVATYGIVSAAGVLVLGSVSRPLTTTVLSKIVVPADCGPVPSGCNGLPTGNINRFRLSCWLV